MARPDCPRCGSDLVAVAVPDSPSEWVEALRGGSARAHPVTLGEANWLCRVCGNRWQPPPEAEPPDLGNLEGEDPGHGNEALVQGNGEQGDPAPEDLLQAALEEAEREHADLQPRDLEPGDLEPGDLEPGDADQAPPMRQFVELLNLGPERSFVSAGSEPTLKDLPDPRRRRSVVGVLLAMASLAVVVVLALQAPRSSPLSDLPEPSDAAATADAPVTPPPRTDPEPRGLRMVLDVEQRCWVRVIADGEFVDEITLEPGDRTVYRAKRDLQLRLGNAGGVTLRVNGEPYRTGLPGDVTTITFSWRDGDVHVERVTLS
jgi:Domain of unknown function (DUF4115)